VFHNVRVGEDRDPVTGIALGSLDAVHAETTRQTGNTSKHGLESLGHMVGDIILED
jgi:hypothetical protein